MKKVQYAVSRQIIHFGLWVMPDGAFKRRLLQVLWDLSDEVNATIVKSQVK